jgi:HEAT repeat protein
VQNLSGSRPTDTELLVATLRDKHPHVRCAAVRTLAKTKTPESLRSLMGALRDVSFEVREASAHALGRFGDPASANALAACLSDPDAAVRVAAAGSLRSLGWKPSTREELARFEIALGHTPDAMSTNNAPAAPANEPNQDTTFHRRMAAEMLKASTDPARIISLLADLRGNNLLARVSAVHDLGQLNDPRITEELLKLFRHPDPETRLVAAQVLAERGDSRPAHFLGLLQDASEEVRLTAVKFLGRVPHEQIVPVLAPLLSDPSVLVRDAAASAIGQISLACGARA